MQCKPKRYNIFFFQIMRFLYIFIFLAISLKSTGICQQVYTQSPGICQKDLSVQICENVPELFYITRLSSSDPQDISIVSILACNYCNLRFTNPDYTQGLTGLEVFEAAHSEIDFPVDIFRQNQDQVRLQSITFRNCTFKGMGVLEMFGFNRHLKELYLDNIEIHKLGRDLDGTDLEILRLDRVKMHSIEDGVLSRNLRILHLNYNKLTSKAIESKFASLDNLEELSLKGNRLTNIYTGDFPLSLKTLDVSSNPILVINFYQFLYRGQTTTIKMHEVPCSTLEALNGNYRFKKERNTQCRTKTFDFHKCDLLHVIGEGANGDIVIGENLLERDDPSWWLDKSDGIECMNFPEILAQYEGEQVGLEQAAAEMIIYYSEVLQKGIENLDLNDKLSETDHDLISNVKTEWSSLNRYKLLIENQITKY